MTQSKLWAAFRIWFPVREAEIKKAQKKFTISMNELGGFEFKPKTK